MKIKNTYIRSTKCSLKYNNRHRKDELSMYINEYKRVARELVKLLWLKYGLDNLDESIKLPTYIEHHFFKLNNIKTFLSTNVMQAVGKQVLAILKGTITKQKQRLYVLKKLKENGEHKRFNKLKRIIDEQSISCPNISNMNPELPVNCFKDLKLSADGLCWVSLINVKNRESKDINIPKKINLCFKLHKHFNSLKERSIRMFNSISLTENNIGFAFEFEIKQNENEQVIGCDIGINKLVTLSTGVAEFSNNHNQTYSSILDKLCRKKKGSKSFKRTQEQRKNFINWLVKRVGIENAATLRVESIKDMYRGRNTCRKHKHFNYRDIFVSLNNYALQHGVRVEQVNQRYTSQRCSRCGYVHKKNRVNQEVFKCKNCGNIINADFNASINISFGLQKLTKKQCNGLNKTGFFWDVDHVRSL